MATRANRHMLTIRHIQQEDFGNYRWVLLRVVVQWNPRIDEDNLWLTMNFAGQRWFSQFGNFDYNLFHFLSAS